MDPQERQIARAIAPGLVTYPPGTNSKRFAREMATAADMPDPPALTPKQRKFLLDLAVRYRRQVSTPIVELARRLLKGGS